MPKSNPARSTAIRRVGLAIVLAALPYGCASTPAAVAPPDVELSSLSLVEAEGDSQRFRLTLRLHNASDVAIPIESLRFTARLAGQGLLMGQSLEPIELPARGTRSVEVDVTTELVSSVSSLLSMVRGPNDAIGYELNGAVMVSGRIERRLAFSRSGEVPLTATMGAP